MIENFPGGGARSPTLTPYAGSQVLKWGYADLPPVLLRSGDVAESSVL